MEIKLYLVFKTLQLRRKKEPEQHHERREKELDKGPFKYYVIKDVGGWGQKMAILDDLHYCKSSKSWVGGRKKVKNMMT